MASLTTKSKFDVIQFFKDEGNISFKKQEFHQSLEFYQNCLSFLDCIHFEQTNGNATRRQHQDEDVKESESNKNIGTRGQKISSITAVILSNIAQTHLQLHASSPDLYIHLFAALNCSQMSVRMDASNTKSVMRRICSLYRLGLYEYAESILNEQPQLSASAQSLAVIEREKKKVENRSVHHHVQRFMHALLSNDGDGVGGLTHQNEEDPQKNVFLRIAGAELIRQHKLDLDDFMQRFFSGNNVQSLQVITMLGIVLNWDCERLCAYVYKYVKIYSKGVANTESLPFGKLKQIIQQTVNIEGVLWITDQVWKPMLRQLIPDRHELQWSDVLNCSDHGVLDRIYDKYKHRMETKVQLRFRQKSDADTPGSDIVKSEINELKRMREVDRGNSRKLYSKMKELEDKCVTLEKSVSGCRKILDDAVCKEDCRKQEMGKLNARLTFYMQIVTAIFAVVIGLLLYQVYK